MTKPTVLLLSSVALAGCASTVQPGAAESEPNVATHDDIDLNYLREEEKLARDVYLALHERWQHRVFKNIAASEQRHLDIATAALRRSGTEVHPRADRDDARGVFMTESLRSLYQKFVKRGKTSLTAALEVGATIEDLDIRDLDAMIAKNPEPELRASLERLRCASGNHMRAFVSHLRVRGQDYRAQYISQVRLDEVLAMEHQRCGRGHGKHGHRENLRRGRRWRGGSR